MSDHVAIANEILRQLGGAGRLKASIAAKDFVALDARDGKGAGLGFNHMRGEGGVNRFEIRLNAGDLYDMAFYRVRGINCALVAEDEDVFVGDLAERFRASSGLAIRL